MDEDRNTSRSPSPGVSRSGSRNSLNNGCNSGSRTSLIHRNQCQSAKHICFFRNADLFYGGLKLAVSAEKYKEFESLLNELSEKMNLTTGAVRNIFDADDGHMVTDISQLHHGTAYVCSSTSCFDKMDGKYGKCQQQWSLHTKGNSQGLTNWGGCPGEKRASKKYNQREHAAKLVTVFKNGKPPREKVTMILNHKFISLDQVLDLLSAKETLGKVDKLYTKSGKLMRELDDLFEDDTAHYIALSANERFFDDGQMSDMALPHRTTPYRDLKRPSTGGLKRSSSVRTPRKRRDSGGSECDSGRHPVRRSQSVKGTNSGRSSRGRSASPGPMQNGHTPRSKSPKSPISPGKKTPMCNANEELYPAQVFEKDSSDTGKFYRLRSKRERLSVHGFYKVGKIIGDGNFAVVRECKCRKTSKDYALKVINRSKVKGKEHMIENEIEILRRLHHPNIVQLIEEFQTPKEIFLVMELVKGGDLFDAIVKAKNFTEKDASHMTRDLMLGVAYLHSKNIVHRDIKPENLLVVNNSDGSTSLKLADFGLAMEVKSPMFLVCGTPTYVAPEILDESGYGLKVDVWAAGVITYILLCGFPPFRSQNQDALFDLILSGKYEYVMPFWEDISDSARNLVDQMLVVDENRRLSALDVLEHPWIKGQTAKDHDLHQKVKSEINRNFESRKKFRGAVLAVQTVIYLTKKVCYKHPRLLTSLIIPSTCADVSVESASSVIKVNKDDLKLTSKQAVATQNVTVLKNGKLGVKSSDEGSQNAKYKTSQIPVRKVLTSPTPLIRNQQIKPCMHDHKRRDKCFRDKKNICLSASLDLRHGDSSACSAPWRHSLTSPKPQRPLSARPRMSTDKEMQGRISCETLNSPRHRPMSADTRLSRSCASSVMRKGIGVEESRLAVSNSSSVIKSGLATLPRNYKKDTVRPRASRIADLLESGSDQIPLGMSFKKASAPKHYCCTPATLSLVSPRISHTSKHPKR